MEELDIMLMETGSRDPDMQRALSSGLRRRREIGQLAELTGDDVLKPFGHSLGTSVDREVINESNRLDKKSQRDMTQGYYDQMGKQQGLSHALATRRQDEIERHNKMMEEVAGLKAGQGKAPPVGVQKQAQEAVGEFEAFRNLSKSFTQQYANNTWNPLEGSMSNTIGPTVFGTQSQKDQAEWWRKYRKQYELGARNRLFGSALTAPEIAAWEAASISPNSPPDVIRKALDTMMMVSQRVLLRQAQGHAAVYDPVWIQAAYGEAQFDDYGGGSQGEAPSMDAGDWFEKQMEVPE
jgi:hypothetical protein